MSRGRSLRTMTCQSSHLEEPAARTGRLTSIKLLAVGLEGAAVVDTDLVALDRLALALDREGDVNLEVIGSQDTNGGRGEEREGQENAHFDK